MCRENEHFNSCSFRTSVFRYFNKNVNELAIMVIPFSYSLTYSVFSTCKPGSTVTVCQNTFSVQCIAETFPYG